MGKSLLIYPMYRYFIRDYKQWLVSTSVHMNEKMRADDVEKLNPST